MTTTQQLKITRESLLTLEAYSRGREAFRQKVIAHKRLRNLALGAHVTLLFEDELTIRYQIQEMLRIEKIFEEQGIQDELDAYTPLIPDGRNFKATMMIEYEDPAVRAHELTLLKGVERKVWVQVSGHEKSWAIADEDLPRENDTKTSAVHFLRLELTDAMASDLKAGKDLSFGVEHSHYQASVEPVSASLRASLIGDIA